MVPAFVTALAGSYVEISFCDWPAWSAHSELRNNRFSSKYLAEISPLKKLGFEAHTYLVVILRQQIIQSNETQPRKVAYAECI